jgi:creatinine amidohydrolase
MSKAHLLLALLVASPAAADEARPHGRRLAQMTWGEAKAALTPDTVVVIPLGAGAKEHGLHLPLDADLRQAEHFAAHLLAAADVVVAPTVSYSYYPAFVEYPGTTSLELPAARELIVDLVRSLARFGPRRFYVLNIGVSTNKPLAEAQALLALDGVALRYLDLTGAAMEALEKRVATQREGSHADEVETSILLAIDPRAVDMSKAATEYTPGTRPGPFSPVPGSPRYSSSGVYGDARRATAAKGRLLVDGIDRIVRDEVEALRRAAPPAPARLFGRLTPTAPP